MANAVLQAALQSSQGKGEGKMDFVWGPTIPSWTSAQFTDQNCIYPILHRRCHPGSAYIGNHLRTVVIFHPHNVDRYTHALHIPPACYRSSSLWSQYSETYRAVGPLLISGSIELNDMAWARELLSAEGDLLLPDNKIWTIIHPAIVEMSAQQVL